MSDSDLSDDDFDGTSVNAEFKTGFNVGGILGYKFRNGLRLEGEYTYRRADIDEITANGVSASSIGVDVGGDVSAHAAMANVFWEPRVFGNWLPSIGGGVGVGFVNAEVTVSSPEFAPESDDSSDTVFAYQAGAGLGYAFTDNVIGSIDYRYWATTDPNFDGTDAEIGTHNVSAGVRVQF
ncbi:MAG: outer membrane beta-barrel protein [Acidobacteriota bacterium]